MRRLLLLFLPLAACAEGSHDLNAELRIAQERLAAEDFDAAFAEYSRIEEETGNALAQFTLGLFFKLGWGRAVDRDQAAAWFEKAAHGQIPAAQHFWAEHLAEGARGQTDPAEAALWYQRAADGGHFLSLYSLAEMHFDGRGVPRDPAKGLQFCLRAARRGVVAAQVRAGRLLFEGDEVKQDLRAAGALFEQAAQKGDPEARYYLGVITRDGLGRSRSPEAAERWLESAAGQGYVRAYLPTAEIYFAGHGGKPPAEHMAKAYMWASAAAQRAPETKEREQADTLRRRILEVMPETWRADLDEKVKEHLATHRDGGGATGAADADDQH